MSERHSSNKKRSASAAGMGPPDKEPKKTKMDIALETRLVTLQNFVSEIYDAWKPVAPDGFIGDMYRMRDHIRALNPNVVGQYVKGYGLRNDLSVLKMHEANLNDPLPPIDSGKLEAAKELRQRMLEYVAEVRALLVALADQFRVKPSPHKFADSKEWRELQQRSDAILCLRPADKRGLPIPLMHTAFCKFIRHFHEPLLDGHTSEYLSIADKLCQVMPSAFDSENARQAAFEEIFSSFDDDLRSRKELPLEAKPSTVVESTGKVDMAKTIGCKEGELVVLLGEFKAESTGDAYMQVCRSYEVLCGAAKNTHLLKFGYPMFLLCVLGPYFMVCGAIKHENAHVEPLTPLLPMFPGFGIEGRPVQIAYCLRALKDGLDALRGFWKVTGIVEDINKKATTENLPEPYFVPGCPDNGLLRFDDWQGTFESPMHNGNNSDKLPSFLAKLRNTQDECQRQVVVKFVYNYSGTYGTAVHQHLYSLELAPRLYYAEELHRGLVMVVMEHLSFEKGSEGWVELDIFKGKLGSMANAVRNKLENIVDSLQDQQMVHADLRPTNIMVKVDRENNILTHNNEPILRVVDFDWSGKVNEVRYPPTLNPNIPWPTGAGPYEKVGENHDRVLLNNWWDKFVKG
ncbi:hypothetical protein CPB86DRAFT_755649 [Serendipita vermifera]|nr:hypothetical protein CPB86DRAFT_755649 [Serendipita vermifera]